MVTASLKVSEFTIATVHWSELNCSIRDIGSRKVSPSTLERHSKERKISTYNYQAELSVKVLIWQSSAKCPSMHSPLLVWVAKMPCPFTTPSVLWRCLVHSLLITSVFWLFPNRSYFLYTGVSSNQLLFPHLSSLHWEASIKTKLVFSSVSLVRLYLRDNTPN